MNLKYAVWLDVVTLLRFSVRYDNPGAKVSSVLAKVGEKKTFADVEAGIASLTTEEREFWDSILDNLKQALSNVKAGTGPSIMLISSENGGTVRLGDSARDPHTGSDVEAWPFAYSYHSGTVADYTEYITEKAGERITRSRLKLEVFGPKSRPSTALGRVIENSRTTGDLAYWHLTVNEKLKFAEAFNQENNYIAFGKDEPTPAAFDLETGLFVPNVDHVFGIRVDEPNRVVDYVVDRAIATRKEMVGNMMGVNAKAEKEREEKERKARQKAAKERFEKFSGQRSSNGVAKRSTEEHLFDDLPIAAHGTLSSRQWGIEVESGGALGVPAPKGWKRIGDGSLRSAYSGDATIYVPPARCSGDAHKEFVYDWIDPQGEQYLRNEDGSTKRENGKFVKNPDYVVGHFGNIPNPDFVGHNVECDKCGHQRSGSVRLEGRAADAVGEFVSPILRSVHSRGLQMITDELIKNPQNDSSGVHVHVDAADMTPQMIGSLIYGYDRLEPLIEASYRRQARNYCKLRPANELLDVLRSSKTAKKQQDIPRGDRYNTVNLNALDAHGTIEFRAMGPVYEYEYLIRWAMFCREMVNVSRVARPKDWNQVKTWDDVLALFARLGKEYKVAVFNEIVESAIDPEKLSAKDKELMGV